MWTYAGHPMASARAANIVSALPYPRALYMAGAKRGKPKPARLRKQDTAAMAGYADEMADVTVNERDVPEADHMPNVSMR